MVKHWKIKGLEFRLGLNYRDQPKEKYITLFKANPILHKIGKYLCASCCKNILFLQIDYGSWWRRSEL